MGGIAASQLALPLDRTGTAGDDHQGFLVGTSNEAAVRHLEHHATWPVPASVLTGPGGSGRTMLARLFARATGANIVDQIEGRADEELFHAWNRAHELRRPLLLVADTPPVEWPVTLPDLRSRLMAMPVATIAQPDDKLAQALIERLFAQRAMPVAPDLAKYLVPRIERSYDAIHTCVNLLDQAALAARKRVSVRFAREILGEAGVLEARPQEGVS